MKIPKKHYEAFLFTARCLAEELYEQKRPWLGSDVARLETAYVIFSTLGGCRGDLIGLGQIIEAKISEADRDCYNEIRSLLHLIKGETRLY